MTVTCVASLCWQSERGAGVSRRIALAALRGRPHPMEVGFGVAAATDTACQLRGPARGSVGSLQHVQTAQWSIVVVKRATRVESKDCFR
jgi:microcystin degradation protein MlrC